MSSLLIKYLQLPHTARQSDLDLPDTTLLHRRVIMQKPFLKKIYHHWYAAMMNKLKNIPKGPVLEIGSGGGFLKDLYPGIITSDIMPLPHCDMTFSADAIPFEKESISAIVMVNVFHHLPDCTKFLSEAGRVLKSGGELVMVEPSNCLWSRFIYKNFHHEAFDEKAGWRFPFTGPLSSSNQALPYIVFERDLTVFQKQFPQLALQAIQYLSPVSYLLSGGVSMKTMVPYWSYGVIGTFEKLFASRYFSMFEMIEIRKK